MYALLVEYGPDPGRPPLPVRWQYRDLLTRQPGYRRRLELQADGYRRLVDLFVFATEAAVEATLASAERGAFVAAQPGCAATSAALVVDEGDPLGAPVVLLRRTGHSSPTGGQQCWRDRLYPVSPAATPW